MNQVIETIRSRRSIRSYLSEQLKDEDINQIIDAGKWAPSGGNSRSATYIIIRNRDILQKLNELAQQEFSKMVITDGMYPNLIKAIQKSKMGKLNFTYQAPALVIVCDNINNTNGMADSVCALANMMLAAKSLDIGSCYVNQIHWLSDNDLMREYLYQLGMDQKDMVYCSLLLGYSKKEPVISDKKGINTIFH